MKNFGKNTQIWKILKSLLWPSDKLHLTSFWSECKKLPGTKSFLQKRMKKMNDMDITWWKERRESTKKQLLEGTMETVRILGEFYARGQLTPELIQAAYAREREKDRFLRLDLEACEAALLGKG
jgi:hypothetical protein